MSDPTETMVKPTEPAKPEAQTQGEPVDKPLGENGEKALKAERDARAAAEKTAVALQKQLDDIAAANLSDLEKAQKQAQEFQDAATKATSEALRYRIAAETGITENVDLILTAGDEETMRRQAALWTDRPTTTAGPRPDLSQGGNGAAPATDKATLFTQFLNQTA